MWQRLTQLADKRTYWLALLLLVLAMEGLALIYQYQWDYQPCVLCIHVRIWLAGLGLVALVGLLLGPRRFITPPLHLLSAVMLGGLLERSYQLLATERGWVFGSCSMDLGLPSWFAIERWFPTVFEVQTTCGYTPELLFGITMAEGLLLFSLAMLLLSGALLVLSLFHGRGA